MQKAMFVWKTFDFSLKDFLITINNKRCATLVLKLQIIRKQHTIDPDYQGWMEL